MKKTKYPFEEVKKGQGQGCKNTTNKLLKRVKVKKDAKTLREVKVNEGAKLQHWNSRRKVKINIQNVL